MDTENESMEIEAKGIPAYGRRYVQYNILGSFFEVPAKYVPPIQPVGRGAYGIVWYVFSIPFFFSFHDLELPRILTFAYSFSNPFLFMN